MGVNFSGDPTARGFFAPLRFEATLIDCEVEGEIPAGLNGSFYRSCIDRRYPPRYPDDTPYNADGAVDLFRFINGHVDFRSRYIQTPRLLAETAARRALFGRYRNRSTYDPAVRDVSPNTGNTTPIIHHGRLFSMKEDSPPMALDPDTLETIGEWDFHGQMRAKTFTAHPKIDPNNGDLIAFSYEARGDVTPDLAVFVFDKHGKLKREWWFKSPVVSMMHDMAITDRHIILPTTGMVTNQERLEAGLIHWTYDKHVPCHVAIIPRDGDEKDIRWFHGTPEQAMLVHTTNARTEGNKVILDAPVASNNFHPFFPNADGSAFEVAGVSPNIRRWTFDLDSKDTGWKEESPVRRPARHVDGAHGRSLPHAALPLELHAGGRSDAALRPGAGRQSFRARGQCHLPLRPPHRGHRPAVGRQYAQPVRAAVRAGPGGCAGGGGLSSSPWPTTTPRCARSW